MRWKTLRRKKHKKKSGWLSELISMDYDDEPFDCVHTYVVSFKPNTKRAMHYHKEKHEWITVGVGKVKLVLKDLNDGEREEIILNENDEKQKIIYIPPKVAHVLKNIGEDKACVIAFSQTPELPGDTIEYEMDV